MNQLKSLQNNLGYEFKNIELLEQALTHKSFSNEKPEYESNERLEFLGDAVLELSVTDYLFTEFPDKNEGVLTSLRSALVRGKQIALVLKNLDALDYIKLSAGEKKSNGQNKSYIQANVFEAIVGAIYLDGGYKSANQFIHTHLLPTLTEILEQESYIDSKSKLQEISQERFNVTPTYHFISESGPDHNKKFTMSVNFLDKIIATGEGSSKQKAEINAAFNALNAIENK